MIDTSVSYDLTTGQGKAAQATHDGSGARQWLVLTHHLPAKPGYLRVKVGRRLERIGAVAVKNSVYALPPGDETLEDFQWLRREIADGGGETSLCLATFIDGETDGRLIAESERARNADYRAIRESLDELRHASSDAPGDRDDDLARLATLRARLASVLAIDFFGASEAGQTEAAVRSLEAALRRVEPAAQHASSSAAERMVGRTWVTRQGVKVDRISSAWLIRRFIDADAVFKFVTATGYAPRGGELRFDMYDGEFTHVGDSCTFETLLRHFRIEDSALSAIGEIVHDIDLKDERFGRPEVAGIAAVLDGMTAASTDDLERIRRGTEVLDGLYERLRI